MKQEKFKIKYKMDMKLTTVGMSMHTSYPTCHKNFDANLQQPKFSEMQRI